LAWSERNNSAGVTIEAQAGQGKLVCCNRNLQTDDEIIAFISKVSKANPVIVGIDAPLIVPNEDKSRPCDREVTKAFGQYQAGAYPANRARLKKYGRGRVRGEDITNRLEKSGFSHNYDITRQSCEPRVIEVYPHPATIELFGLKTTLKYKRGDVIKKKKNLHKLQKYIEKLREQKPSLRIKEKYLCEIGKLIGKRLKEYEDFLDAILCAYIVYHAWYWGEAGYKCYGNIREGCILVPQNH